MFVQTALDSFLFPEASSLAAELDRSTSPGFRRLNAAVAQLVDEWSMVSFAALDYSDEESIGDVLAQIDHCIQVGAPHTHNCLWQQELMAPCRAYLLSG